MLYNTRNKYERFTMEKTKATMEVNAKKWERFKKIAKINNSTASQEFRKFMDRYLAENSQLDLKV